MTHNRNRESGFTIIEAVVAAAVFAFVVVSSMGVYLATVQLDSKSRAERAVLQNSRFIMDYLAKEIRNGRIDYSKTNDANTLNIINQSDEAVTLDWASNNITLTKNAVWSTTLNSDDVRVTNLQFYLTPNLDPYVLANNRHIQPHVTVFMRLESTNPKAIETAKIQLQSTFATRDYPAR
jgi:type II secretory pathway pseudopilin PulG